MSHGVPRPCHQAGSPATPSQGVPRLAFVLAGQVDVPVLNNVLVLLFIIAALRGSWVVSSGGCAVVTQPGAPLFYTPFVT